MKEWEVLFINGRLGSRDNSEQKQHITQRISIFESGHLYSSMSRLHAGNIIVMLLSLRQQRVWKCWVSFQP